MRFNPESSLTLSLVLFFAFAAIMTGCAVESDEDPSDLRVITVTPANGQSNVLTSSTIIIRFSEPIDHRTVIGTQQIILADQANSVVPISYSFQGENVILTPGSPLASGATYGVAIRPGVRDIYGNNMAQPYAALFSTGANVGSIPNWPPFTWNPPSTAPSFPQGQFTMVGQLWVPRMRHRAVLLDSGKALICGGLDAPATTAASRSVEIYDPTTRTWSLSASNSNRGMHYVRYDHTVLKLLNGHILVTGGGDNVSIWDTCEEYNPLTDSFSLWAAKLQIPRASHTCDILANGNPIVLGGVDNTGATQHTIEIFDYQTGAWTFSSAWLAGAGIGALRAGHTTTTLADGALLNAGANANTADLYFPGTASGINGIGQYTGTLMAAGRTGHQATLVTTGYAAGLVVVTGGFRNDITMAHGINMAEVYDHNQMLATGWRNGAQGVWTPVGQTMLQPLHFHTATWTNTGKILVVGGYSDYVIMRNPASVSNNGEVMDLFSLGHNVNAPFAGIDLTSRFDWTRNAQGNQTIVPNLFTGLAEHTATTLLDGTILITGGLDYIPPPIATPIVVGSSWIYKP